MAAGRKWIEREIEAAIELYFITPFGKLHSNNPDIVSLAESLNRSPSSVALKLVNLASIDETLERKGMSNYSKLDKQVWDSVFDRLLNSAANIKDELELAHDSGFGETSQAPFSLEKYVGEDRFVVSTTRQGQSRFRRMISANYDNKCAISGIVQPELLVAGHISPWADDRLNRMNPRNGILLNRLHDKAFDEGLITISDDNKILYSKRLDQRSYSKLKDIEQNGFLRLPNKFRPDPALVQKHRERFDFREIY